MSIKSTVAAIVFAAIAAVPTVANACPMCGAAAAASARHHPTYGARSNGESVSTTSEAASVTIWLSEEPKKCKWELKNASGDLVVPTDVHAGHYAGNWLFYPSFSAEFSTPHAGTTALSFECKSSAGDVQGNYNITVTKPK